MVIGWILGIALTILGLYLFIMTCIDDEDDVIKAFFSAFILFVGVIIILGVSGNLESKDPQLIDVYRGRTTLRVTYQDSIPTDTVVVWKDEFNPRKKKK